ncbi:MAG: hypothetical protein ACKUBY_02300 [Candidatus Moraniibacteriota bacterium]|jgi:hypothetical protein
MKPEHLTIMFKGRCPKCEYENNSKEVRYNGSSNHYEHRIPCANCKHYFTAHLEVEGSNPKNLVYLDYNQLFQAIHDAVLSHKRKLSGYSFLKENYPELFWNLLHRYSQYRSGAFMFRIWRERYIEKLYGCKVKH